LLLCFALLIPTAQAAAAWHAISHTPVESSGDAGGKPVVHLNDCALCLTAAAMSGGALVGQLQGVTDSAARYPAPLVAAEDVWPPFPPRAYLSRAPPCVPY